MYVIGRNTKIHLPIEIPFVICGVGIFDSMVLMHGLNLAQNEFKKVSNNDISPIPITEEWLIKLGFERKSKDNEFVWVTKFYMFLNIDSGWYFRYKFDGFISFCFGDLFVKELRYVHQLQNLYFALTEEELEIIH